MHQTRRDFLKASCGVVVCTCGAGATSSCAFFGTSKMATAAPEAVRVEGQKILVELTKVPALAQVGGAVKVAAGEGEEKVCVIRSGEARFGAFINRCTHSGWELDYKHGEKRLRCASFGHSEFDLEGRRQSGPATANLTKLEVLQRGDVLEVLLES